MIMHEYQVRVINRDDGSVMRTFTVSALHVQEAIRAAREAEVGEDLEVWRDGHLVELLPGKRTR
jgi:hypothetical protein